MKNQYRVRHVTLTRCNNVQHVKKLYVINLRVTMGKGMMRWKARWAVGNIIYTLV